MTYDETITEIALAWAREAGVPEKEHLRFLQVIGLIVEIAGKAWVCKFVDERGSEKQETVH